MGSHRLKRYDLKDTEKTLALVSMVSKKTVISIDLAHCWIYFLSFAVAWFTAVTQLKCLLLWTNNEQNMMKICHLCFTKFLGRTLNHITIILPCSSSKWHKKTSKTAGRLRSACSKPVLMVVGAMVSAYFLSLGV